MGECGILAFGGAWIPIARRRVGLRLSILSYLHHALSRLVDSTAPAEERPLQLYRIHAPPTPLLPDEVRARFLNRPPPV